MWGFGTHCRMTICKKFRLIFWFFCLLSTAIPKEIAFQIVSITQNRRNCNILFDSEALTI
jgi:hypothetical protein